MGRLFRVIKVLNVFSRYRLNRLLPAHPVFLPAHLLTWLMPGFWLPAKTDNPAVALRMALEELGPIFIKFGQLLATRKDLLSEEVAAELAKLQDQVPPFASSQAIAIIEAELNQPVSALYQRFDAEPMASASIAQVHSAALHDGREVVVKVVRPKIHRTVKQDLAVMKTSARLLELFWRQGRYFHPTRVVDDYAQIIHDELNLAQEASNSERMQQHFAYSDLLHIPTVHKNLSTARVMTLDRIYGIPVTDTETLKAHGIDLKLLAERGVEIFFTQVFRHNFFHADMHPGNIFVSPDHIDPPQYQAIDCAIAGSLSRADQMLLAQLALLVLQKDYGRIVRLIVEAGWVNPALNLSRLESQIQNLADPIFEQPLDQIEFAPLLMELLSTVREFQMEFPTQYVLLIKTLVHIEGLGQQIYPALDIWSIGRPMLQQWMNEQIGPKALARQVQLSLPEWMTHLPELPTLLHGALREVNQLSNYQQQLRQDRQQLQQSLRRTATLGTLTITAALAGVVTAFWPYYLPNPGDIPSYSWALLGSAATGWLVLAFRK